MRNCGKLSILDNFMVHFLCGIFRAWGLEKLSAQNVVPAQDKCAGTFVHYFFAVCIHPAGSGRERSGGDAGVVIHRGNHFLYARAGGISEDE